MKLLAAMLMLVPVLPSELNEYSGAKEQVQDVSLLQTGIVGKKRLCLNSHCSTIIFPASLMARNVRDHLREPGSVRGHRLPNDLLAPMTC
jgi:hypothetical protein